MPRLVRQLAKECAARSAGPGREYSSAIAARWAARLSALLMRGNAAVQRAARTDERPVPRPWSEDAGALPHLLPEGECLYELVCLPGLGNRDELAA